MKHKPDWDVILYVTFLIGMFLLIVTAVILKIWVTVEYGSMPITEVPSWAIPWLK
jgi:Fe2+ transport system protein B